MINEAVLNDDFFKRLNTQDAFCLEKKTMNEFWNSISEQVIQQIIQRFQIGDLVKGIGNLEEYKDGGDVSTLHNADNNVFIDQEHERRYKQSFDRKNYEGRKDSPNGDNTLNSQRKQLFKKRNIYDDYTNKKLHKDGRTHLDHIVSAKRIHENNRARLFMTDDERNDMAVSKENLAVIDGRMNQSKGASSVSEWLDKKKGGKLNSERYGVDVEKAKGKEYHAEKFIKNNIFKSEIKEISRASFKRGRTLAKEQIIGVIFTYVTKIIVDELKEYAKNWEKFDSIAERIDALKTVEISVKNRVLSLLKNSKAVFKELLINTTEGFISGIVGTIVTTIVNMFITTMKKFGKIIQDNISAFVSAFKLLTTNPQNLSKAELFKTVVKKISMSLAGTMGLFIEEFLKDALLSTPLAPLAKPMSVISGILVGGAFSGIVIYAVNNLGSIIKKFKEGWSSIKKGLELSPEAIMSTYTLALKKIDDAYQAIIVDIGDYYKKLGKLADLAHDMNQFASSQVSASINYASASGVLNSDILHNIREADNFFLN